MLAIRFTFELRDNRRVNRAVKHRHRQMRVAEVLRPVLEVNVRYQRRRFSPTAVVNDLVQKTGSLGVLAQFQFLETEFVNDHQVEATIMANPARECFASCRGAEILQQVRARDVFDSKAMAATTTTNGLDEMTLSQTARAREDDIVLPPNEFPGTQLFELRAIDRTLVEFPIEAFERRRRGEGGDLDSSRDTPLATRVRGYRQESFQQAQGGQLFLLRRGNDFIQLLSRQWGFQRLQVLEDSLTLLSRITLGCRRSRRCLARDCLLRRSLVVRPARRRHGFLPHEKASVGTHRCHAA